MIWISYFKWRIKTNLTELLWGLKEMHRKQLMLRKSCSQWGLSRRSAPSLVDLAYLLRGFHIFHAGKFKCHRFPPAWALRIPRSRKAVILQKMLLFNAAMYMITVNWIELKDLFLNIEVTPWIWNTSFRSALFQEKNNSTILYPTPSSIFISQNSSLTITEYRGLTLLSLSF